MVFPAEGSLDLLIESGINYHRKNVESRDAAPGSLSKGGEEEILPFTIHDTRFIYSFSGRFPYDFPTDFGFRIH